MMANAPNAVEKSFGIENFSPSAMSLPLMANSVNCSEPSATPVKSANSTTMPMHTPSTSRYLPESSSAMQASATAAISARCQPESALTIRLAMPPIIPATCIVEPMYMTTQNQTIHETRSRGPGTLSIASSVVLPLVTV